ncbi:hypothetical protein SteCoe_15041 [Stentor coeruleus]|uniref:Uncharacterized protein n=1 Tax=Stentor coeruleus TaxID=5963 RepID=A0A1R2C4I9_9CILI|nr:hypothetical protein SteCoe_15041 [Stentor coeruleus]
MRNSLDLDKKYSKGSFRKTESLYVKPHHEKFYSARGLDFAGQSFMSMSYNEYKPNYKFNNSGYLSKMQEISTDLADVYEFRKRCFGKIQSLESAVERNKTTYENEITYLEEYINLLKRKAGSLDSAQGSYLNFESYSNSKLINENENLKSSLKNLENQYQLLKNDNYSKRQEIQQLSRQIHEQKDLTDLFDIISSLEETKNQNEDYIQKIQEDKKHLKALLKQKTSIIKSIEKTKTTSSISQNDDEIGDVIRFKQTLQQKVDESIKMFEKKFEGTMERAQALDEESARLGKISGVLKEKLKNLQEKSRNWPDNQSFSYSKYKELESENSILEDRIDQMAKEKKILEENISKLENKLQLSYEKAKRTMDELAKSTEIIRRLEGKLGKNEEDLLLMKQEIEMSKNIANKAQKSEQDLKAKHDKLCLKIQSAKHSKLENPPSDPIAQASQEELKKELNSLNELIKSMNCAHKKLKDDKNDLINQVQILKNEHLKTKNMSQESLTKNYGIEMKELICQLEKQKIDIESLRDKAEETNKILRQQIVSKNLEIEKLQKIITRSIENMIEMPMDDKKHMTIIKMENKAEELEYLKSLTEGCEGLQQDKLSMRYLDIIDELIEKIKDYIYSTDCLQESLSESESKLSSHHETVYKLESKLKDLTEKSYFQANTIQSLQKKIEVQESPSLIKTQEHDQKILKLKQQLKIKTSEVEKLQEILQNSLKKLFSSDSESDKLRLYLQPKGVMSTKSLAKLRNVPTELIPIKSCEIIRDLIEKLDYVIKKNDELDEVLKSSQAQAQDLTLTLNSQKEAFDEYNELLLAKQALETTTAKDKKEKAKLAGEVSMLRAENKDLMKKKLAYKTKRDDLLRKIEDMENNMEKDMKDFDKDQLDARVYENKNEEENFALEMQELKEKLEIAQGLICDYEYAEQDLKEQLEKEKACNEELTNILKNLEGTNSKEKTAYENASHKLNKIFPKNNYEFETTLNDMKNIIDQEKYEHQQFTIELKGNMNSDTGALSKEKSKALNERITQQSRFIEELQEKLLALENLPILVNQIDTANSEILTQTEKLDTLTDELSKAEEKISRQDLIIVDLEQKLCKLDNYEEILNELLEVNTKLDRQNKIIDELEEKLKSQTISGSFYKDLETLSNIESSYKNPNPHQAKTKSLYLPASKTIDNEYNSSLESSSKVTIPNFLIKKIINDGKMPENFEEAKSHILILRQALEDFQYKNYQQSGFTEVISSEIISPENEKKLLAKLKYQSNLITELENKNLELESRFNRIRNKNNILESNTKKYSENVEKVFRDVNKKLQIIEKNLKIKEERVQSVFNDYLRFKKKYIAGIQEKAKVLIENMQFGQMEGFSDEGVEIEKDDVIHLLKARVEFLQDKIDCLVKSNYVTKEIIENISDKAQDAIDLIKVE